MTWGDPRFGGHSSQVQEQLTDVQQVQATSEAFAAIRVNGFVVTWGHADGGNSTQVQTCLALVVHIQASRWPDGLCTYQGSTGVGSAFAAITQNGAAVTWGSSGHGGDSRAVREQLVRVKEIQATGRAFDAIRDDGTVVTWGDPEHGGDSSKVARQLTRVLKVQATWGAFAASRADGNIVRWGHADFGAGHGRVCQALDLA